MKNIAMDKFKANHSIIFLPADKHRCACNALAICIENASVTYHIDAMKQHSQKVAGITDIEILK